ncbi:unnamed protein product [Pleuronectes platessa]|uniref:Uncharacterized protein n=1 Tax=Pleuronectes platessa TaxID=8262 RepID=A0A9N7Z8E2_PLEPL|nr:unnamed protein product [Pleuronectes platessa]
MPLQENTTMDKPSRDRLTHRLYPSLPNVDSYDRRVGEKLPEAAEELRPRGCTRTNSRTCSRKELISINDKWAKEYQTMVRFYREKVQLLKAALQQNHSQVEEGLCEEEEKHVTLCKKTKLKTCDEADVNSELLKVEQEARELRGQNCTLTRRGQHQSEEIKRLNKVLAEAFLTSPPVEGSSETLQDIWKQQAELRVLKTQVTWTQTPQPGLERVGSNRVKLPNQPLNQKYLQIQRGQIS